jgi:hypothetical protein
MRSDAYLSDDRKYRYWLLRVWDDSLPINCTCGVNPSTADERRKIMQWFYQHKHAVQ